MYYVNRLIKLANSGTRNPVAPRTPPAPLKSPTSSTSKKKGKSFYEPALDYLKNHENMGQLATGAGVGLGALGLSSAFGVSGANAAQRRLASAGFSEDEIDQVLTDQGAVARSLGNTALYGVGGGALGYGLGSILDRKYFADSEDPIISIPENDYSAANALGLLGGLAGSAFGAQQSYSGEDTRARKAIDSKKMKSLEAQARKSTKKKKKKKVGRAKKASMARHMIGGSLIGGVTGGLTGRQIQDNSGGNYTGTGAAAGALAGLGLGRYTGGLKMTNKLHAGMNKQLTTDLEATRGLHASSRKAHQKAQAANQQLTTDLEATRGLHASSRKAHQKAQEMNNLNQQALDRKRALLQSKNEELAKAREIYNEQQRTITTFGEEQARQQQTLAEMQAVLQNPSDILGYLRRNNLQGVS